MGTVMDMFARNDPRRPRFLRGLVLRLVHTAGNGEALNPDDPFAMSRDVLTMTMEQLRNLPAEAELNAVLRYLEDKNYLEVAWKNDGSGSFEYVRLLASGMDVVEATVSDPGVLLQVRRS